MPQCPVCADPRRRLEQADVRDTAFAAAPGVWQLQRCQGCQALYLDPRPDRASIHLAYRNYYTHAAASRAGDGLLSWMKAALTNGYRNRVFATSLRPSVAAGSIVMPLFPARAASIRREDRGIGRAGGPGRRVLDVGCGNGQFLSWAREWQWECHGVEMDAAAAQIARDRGISILGSQLEELAPEHGGSFDAITLSHVIEHVYDPVDVLRRCHQLLKPGGYLWLETPNTDSLGYALYGAHWRGLEAPRHLALLNFASLRWSLERAE
ncbi:MAG: class I SAM-dependent methyltransferase, partial [Steroidobacteraceae bacterium]